jgi:hypothetical protein
METNAKSRSSRRVILITIAVILALIALLMVWVMLSQGLTPRRMARVTLDTTLAVLDSRRVESYNQGDYTNIFFLHQSTGANLINDGQMREKLAQAGLLLWDQGYNYLRVADPGGNQTRYSYSVPNDETDPLALAQIFSQRAYPLPLNTLSGMLQHEVIVLKSCFTPTSHIESDAELEADKEAYLQIRQRMSEHPDKLFILLTQPPLNPAETNPAEAERARRLADWLVSAEFRGDLPNLYVFDFFDRLAVARGSGPEANMLRPEYRNGGDSHPNTQANEEISPDLAEFIQQAIADFR